MTSTRERQRAYRDMRERSKRQQSRREERIKRLIEQEHERRLHSFHRAPDPVIEWIEGPAPAEDSSVPSDSPESL